MNAPFRASDCNFYHLSVALTCPSLLNDIQDAKREAALEEFQRRNLMSEIGVDIIRDENEKLDRHLLKTLKSLKKSENNDGRLVHS